MKKLKIKNCRNCKWAGYLLTANGRKRYWSYAPCNYPVNIVLPASRSYEAERLKMEVGIAQYSNKPVDCEVWEAK